MKTSSFSIACCLWAAACCSTSAGGGDGRAPRSPAERALDLELALARRPEHYLVVDTGARRLAVKARGLELAAEPLEDAVVARYRRRGGGGEDPAPALPVALEVRAGDSHRRRILVTRELRPYPATGADEEPAAGAPAAAVAAAATPDTAPPSAYRLALDPGWELWVGPRPGGPGAGARFDAGLADLWTRLRGRPPAGRTVIALAIGPEGARRIHHLLRPGARVLVR